MNELFVGARYVLTGFQLIRRPGIRIYVIIPLLINTFLFACAIIFGTQKLNELITWIAAQWDWLEWLGWVLWPLFIIIACIVVFFCFSILANLVAAPFNGFLAAAVETWITGENHESHGNFSELLKEILNAVKSELSKFIYILSRAIPLLLLFVIPLVQVAAPIVWFLFGAWMIALEYFDYPMGNNGMLFPKIRQILASKWKLALGFGCGVLIITMIPIINFIAMPVAVASATKLWVEQIKNL